MSTWMKFGLLISIALLNTVIQGLLRYSFKKMGAVDNAPPDAGQIVKLMYVPTAWLAVFLQVAAFAVWLLAVSRLQLTYALPLSGAFFTLFLFLQGYFILGEDITATRIAGAALITIGALLIEIDWRAKLFSA